MSLSEESISDDGILLFGDKNLAEPCSALIFYKKPSIDEITYREGPLKLSIYNIDGNVWNIHCYVENLKYASEGNYYGPFKIFVADKSQKGSMFKCYFREDMSMKLQKWNAETPLYYINESEVSSMIYKYILDRPACQSCDLSLAPTRIQTLAPTITETSDSKSKGPSLIHYNSKIHGVINIKMDFPLTDSDGSKLLYVIPLEEDIRKCIGSTRTFPLQILRSDASFQIFPCEPGNCSKGAFKTKSCVFDIKVIKNDQTETLWECYIPNVPALLEGLLSCNTHFLVENLKNAYPGIYYGPFEIFVEDKSENGSMFKCYFREDMSMKLQKWKECHSQHFTNNDGKKSSIYKYVLDPTACQLCDLSYVPTRLSRNMVSSSTTIYGSLENDINLPMMTINEVQLKYVIPLEEDIRKCLESGSPYPLQFVISDKCFCIRPCFAKDARIDSEENNSTPSEIFVKKPYGDNFIFVEEMECRIQNYFSLIEREMGNSIECCHYTEIYKNGKKEKFSFSYTKPTHADFTNGRNPHCLETFNGEKSDEIPVYCGDIDSFDPDFYFGPYLIQSVYDDGTRGPWLDCYFRYNPASQKKEKKIRCRIQELEIQLSEFYFKKNPLEGIDDKKKNTQVTKLTKNGPYLVKRTINKHDLTKNDLSKSEI